MNEFTVIAVEQAATVLETHELPPGTRVQLKLGKDAPQGIVQELNGLCGRITCEGVRDYYGIALEADGPTWATNLYLHRNDFVVQPPE